MKKSSRTRACRHPQDGRTGREGTSQRVAENFRDYHVLAERDRRNIERLEAKLARPRVITIPYLDEDVHDIEGLTRIHRFLFATDEQRRDLLDEVVA